MSLTIIKAGISDTVQDLGRYGYQHMGINPGGAMDKFSMQMANMLVGNKEGDAVIEIYFPSSQILFQQDAIIAITGADFTAVVNGEIIPIDHPVVVAKNSLLQFKKWKAGAYCYLAIREKLQLQPWLGSYSTNQKANAGGYHGRALSKDDVIDFVETRDYSYILKTASQMILPWSVDTSGDKEQEEKLGVIAGNEWNWLTTESQKKFLNESFIISTASDRMGYRLSGKLSSTETIELVSSAVDFGTIQLLPNGEMMILMADHQTTGGYPRIAHVASVDLPFLAQKRPGEKISFELIDISQAEELKILEQQHLHQLQNACTFRLEQFFTEHAPH